jgi:hypothetical protein
MPSALTITSFWQYWETVWFNSWFGSEKSATSGFAAVWQFADLFGYPVEGLAPEDLWQVGSSKVLEKRVNELMSVYDRIIADQVTTRGEACAN